MKNSNSTGIIIIVGVLAIAAMKAFDMSFNLENIKIMGSVSIGLIVALLVFFTIQGKKSSNPEHYIDPEPEEENPYNTNYQEPMVPNNQSYQHYQGQDNNDEQSRYQNSVYQQNIQVPPPVPTYAPIQEEDNRWS